VTEPAAQRSYRAPCPGCGAPVEFRSAQSTHAVCGFCRSTVVREGDHLARLGKMADVFSDFSPLQLLASGRWGDRGFTVVGRLLYRYEGGSWTEWQIAFDDGGTGTLSEDNGAFVFSEPLDAGRDLPAAEHLRVGAQTAIQGITYTVAFNQPVSLAAAEGELSHLPPMGQPFPLVELRSASGEVCGLDWGTRPPGVSLGREVRLDDLSLKGLRSESTRDDTGRHFNCPHCGAPVDVALEQSQSVTCRSCNSIIDLSAGVGHALLKAAQDEPVRPLIALGSTGQLQGVNWQVVGFQHRMGQVPGEDEHFGWSEYLLFNRQRGFCFLVDAEDGWSVVKPTTGAPVMTGNGQSASYLGKRYTLQYAYNAETTYVAGEFYWKVARGQKGFLRDFASGPALLSMEQTADELSWSSGIRVSADTVAKAFGLQAQKALLERADASPLSQSAGNNLRTFVIIIVVLVLLSMMESRCSSCDPAVENCSNSYRSSGGSFGGWSSGGGHK
jgi:hypothetical protein